MSLLPRVTAILGMLASLLLFSYAHADMSIEIVGGAAKQISIAIAPFLPPGKSSQDPAAVVRSDLGHSGLFSLVDTTGLGVPGVSQAVSFARWQARGADALVVGQSEYLPNGKLNIQFRLYDVVRETQLAGFSYLTSPSKARNIAHKISDVIYQKLIGVPGDFDGRIAFVLKKRHRYELEVADADGYDNVMIMRSPEPILSPKWSPDGKRMAYVSFERGKPMIFVQDLASGHRKLIADFPGTNSAPAWSPDGKRLAVVLSKDSSSQIYLINARDGGWPWRLTHDRSLDTEPAFSPDGRWIYFTSNRDGGPQIYRMHSTGGGVTRITFDGPYNVSPDVSPDGRYLCFIHQDDSGYHVAVMELATGRTQVLTNTPEDEYPHFAPNSRSILYSTHVGGREVLATVSVDGRVKRRLSLPGDLREPVWKP